MNSQCSASHGISFLSPLLNYRLMYTRLMDPATSQIRSSMTDPSRTLFPTQFPQQFCLRMTTYCNEILTGVIAPPRQELCMHAEGATYIIAAYWQALCQGKSLVTQW